MRKLLRRPLKISEILTWARSYREWMGKWPTADSGAAGGKMWETWQGVDQALRHGTRGLPGDSSLAQLLAEEFGTRNIAGLPPLTAEKILDWADVHCRRTGKWPNKDSGIIPDTEGEKWMCVDAALHDGGRGLPSDLSLAKLLAEHRGVRNRKAIPPLTEEQILVWADVYLERTGAWPTKKSGPIPEAPGETWSAADAALQKGNRGMPGGSSLALLLADKRGVRNVWNRPNLTVEQILAWADAFHSQTGQWPGHLSGPIPEAPGETWAAVVNALKRASRGLPMGLTLGKILAMERDVRNRSRAIQCRLSHKRIVAWAIAHYERTGKWPTGNFGPIPECPGETWSAVQAALQHGGRGLRGGSSIARLLASHGVKRNHHALPRLTYRKILAWADAHLARTGQWPNITSGPVEEAPDEKWRSIDGAMRQGIRGLPGGCSLIQLLVRKRGARNPRNLPPLTLEQVWEWAELHFQRIGRWPTRDSGPIADAPGENWNMVSLAFQRGKRGIPSELTLTKFLAKRWQQSKSGLGQDRRP
ncbi:MAG: hypothetical protein ACLQNE_45025 [Thermoguttaceae bacterium]